jgi:hypothetical protein
VVTAIVPTGPARVYSTLPFSGGRSAMMPRAGSHAELLAHIRQFVNSAGEPAPYDFNGVVHLMLAALDNLSHNALEAELEDIGKSFSEEQAAFFLRLADHIRRGRSV